MQKRKQIPKSPAENAEELQFSCAASSTECTGLIPNLPESEEEAEAYQEIYDFGPPDLGRNVSNKQKRANRK